VIVGEVLSVAPHPNAEKLQIAQVHCGKQILSIVCGAPNCRAGIKTAVATIGASLPGDTPFHITETTIRGEKSHGMLCSADELHLWKDAGGILELPLDLENGADLIPFLWDPVLDCSLTPNLGHALSALGIARELSAAIQKPLHKKHKPLPEVPAKGKLQVTIKDAKLTPRYMGVLIENITIAPSPFWLQKILYSCGMKPICNVVDITNFMMLKFGQPLHAFDAAKIPSHHIQVSSIEKEKEFRGLDGTVRTIPKGTLCITENDTLLAIAGVLGGEASSVHSTTQSIILEGACFDPSTVRKSSKTTGIRTDSAIRFEKGVDPNGVALAVAEATRLILEVCPNAKIVDQVDHYPHPITPKKIQVRPARVNQLIGTKLSVSEMQQIFQRLDCLIEGELTVLPPTYRYDVTEEIDCIEEVARIYGYNHIERNAPKSVPSTIAHDKAYLFEKHVRETCIAQGLQEFLTADLISPKMSELCTEIVLSKGIHLLKTLHAKTEEYSILRPSLLPGLLTTARTNLDFKNNCFRAFEIGRIHFVQKGKSIEIPMLSLLLTGDQNPVQWSVKKQESDFFSLKGIFENICKALRIADIVFVPSNHCSFHPGRQAEVRSQGLVIGTFGELHPQILAKADIKQRLLFGEFNMECLMQLANPKAQFKQVPTLPASDRDWTVTIPKQLQIATVFAAIEAHRPKLLEQFMLLAVYEKEGETHKNITLRFTYRDPIKTISYEEVEKEHTGLTQKVQSHL
jgi:phenylalanyl-tRNA synthetase beta chain